MNATPTEAERLFELLASFALTLHRDHADPLGIFDMMCDKQLYTGDGAAMRRELIEVWRERKHQYAWSFPF